MWFPIDEGIMHFDGEEWSVLTIADGLPDNEVWDGVEDHQGYMWFATPSGLCRYDPTGAGPGEKTMETFTIEDGLADTWTYNAYIDRQGRLWAGSPGGISVYDPAQQIPDEKPHFTIYDMEDGLANNEAWAIFQDAAGYMWIGTADGVSKFDGQVFQTMTSEDGVAGDWVNIIRQES